ncbi:hypothetical protein GRJ2_002573500 [Grus japonensis]|uniref:Uncharacterized protein n=1 Tax=Grus japonensis TaxID=30415 RepID=A0ABC9XTN1_GRUJA
MRGGSRYMWRTTFPSVLRAEATSGHGDFRWRCLDAGFRWGSPGNAAGTGALRAVWEQPGVEMAARRLWQGNAEGKEGPPLRAGAEHLPART